MPLREILTRERWIEIVRIAGVGAVIGLFKLGVAPLPVLLLAIAVGLYPLVKKGSLDAIREHRIGTEIFVTLATVILVIGKEYAAGAILLVIILVAELIAELNSDRARASIKGLIGSVPRTALVKREGREESVPIEQIRVGDVVVVRAGERVPVDGVVAAGQGSVDQSPITGESVPVRRNRERPSSPGPSWLSARSTSPRSGSARRRRSRGSSPSSSMPKKPRLPSRGWPTASRPG